MADRLNVDPLIRVMALTDEGPSWGKDTSVPMPTVAELSPGINAKKSAKAKLPVGPAGPMAPVRPVRPVGPATVEGAPVGPADPAAPVAALVAITPCGPVGAA